MKETNLYLMGKYFPKDMQEHDNDRMAQIRDSNVQYEKRVEPEVCQEVLKVIRTLRKRKSMASIYEPVGEQILKLY